MNYDLASHAMNEIQLSVCDILYCAPFVDMLSFASVLYPHIGKDLTASCTVAQRPAEA